MKLKGRRQSTNVETQTEKQRVAAKAGLKLQEMAENNSTLREPTPIREQGLSEEGRILAEAVNPGKTQSTIASNKKFSGKVTKNPAERRGYRDPSPSKLSGSGDFEFFKHTTKGK